MARCCGRNLRPEDLAFPPVLGTGGNEGRLEYTNNFMCRQPNCFFVGPRRAMRCCATRYSQTIRGFADATAGQFDPGRAGGLEPRTWRPARDSDRIPGARSHSGGRRRLGRRHFAAADVWARLGWPRAPSPFSQALQVTDRLRSRMKTRPRRNLDATVAQAGRIPRDPCPPEGGPRGPRAQECTHGPGVR